MKRRTIYLVLEYEVERG